MNHDNPYLMSTRISTLATAIPVGTAMGVTQGLMNATLGASDVANKASAADECLKTIQASIKAFNEEQEADKKIKGLDLCKHELGDELFGSVEASRDGIASVIEVAAKVMSVVPSHAVQAGLDTGVAATLLSGFILKQLNMNSIHMNSSLLDNEKNFFANCRHLSHIFKDELAELGKKVDPFYLDQGGSAIESHQSIAHALATSGATGVMGTSGGLSLGFDLIGSTLREVQQSFRDTGAHSIQEEKVYKALSECVIAFNLDSKTSSQLIGNALSSQSGPNHTAISNALDKLNLLIAALMDNNQCAQDTKQARATGMRPSTKLAFLSSVPVILTLKSIVLSAIAASKATEALSLKQADLSKMTGHAPVLASGSDEQKNNAPSLNMLELTHGFDQIHQALIELLKEAPDGDRPDIEFSASALHRSTAALSAFPSLLTGLVGLIIRETKEGSIFIKESKLPVEQSKELFKGGDEVGKQLDGLLTALVNTQDALDKANKRNISLPVSTGISKAFFLGSASSALNSGLGILSGIKEFRTLSQVVQADEAELKQRAAEKAKEEQIEARAMQQARASNQASTQFVSRQCAPAIEQVISEEQLASAMHRLIQSRHICHPVTVPMDHRNDLNSTGQTIVSTEHAIAKSVSINTPAFLEAALGTLSLLTLETGFGAEALFLSLSKACQVTLDLAKNIQSITEGPDKIEAFGLKTNFSALSNAARLLADTSAKDSQSTASTVVHAVSLSEAALSRSLTIGLIQHKAFKEALKRLTQAEHSENLSNSQSTLVAADDAVIGQLALVMTKVLDEQNEHKLQNLHQEAAVELALLSQASITAALTVHSGIILPTITAMRALKAGTKDAALHKEEALSHSSAIDQCTKGLNILRGFTLACINELERQVPWVAGEGEFLDIHRSVQSGSMHSAAFAACVTLLLEDLVELSLSRSLSLANQAVIKESMSDTLNAIAEEALLNTEISIEEVKADSNFGKGLSLINSLAAQRLTLTRLGELLMDSADEIARNVANQPKGDILVDKIEMHSLQASLMKAMASALTQGASLITRSTHAMGGLSILPVLLRDRIDTIKEGIHSSDQGLRFGPVKSSRNSSGTPLSLPTAFTADMLVSTITNLIKTLFRASLLGSDVLLSVMKVLEILSLHEHPDVELYLQTRAVDAPNTAKQLPADTKAFATVSIAGLSAVSIEAIPSAHSSFNDSLDSLQNKVDAMIEALDVLGANDESKNSEQISLKKYYRELLKALNIQDTQLDILLDRLNKGGLILSGYHHQYEGIRQDEWEENLTYPEGWDKVHDVSAVRDHFIKLMFCDAVARADSPKLQQFNERIKACGTSLSPEVQKEHEYLIHAIASKLFEAKNTSRAILFNQVRAPFDRDAFIANYVNPFQRDEMLALRAYPLQSLIHNLTQARADRHNRRAQAVPAEEVVAAVEMSPKSL